MILKIIGLIAAALTLASAVSIPTHYGIDTARALFVREAVTIDGRMDEAAWAQADSVRFQFPWGVRRGLPSTGRFLWDDSAFYVAVRMTDDALVAETTPPSTSFGGDDMFEIHWAPDDRLWEYFYIMEYNPNNAIRGRFRKAKARFLPPGDTLNGRNDWFENWTLPGVTIANALRGTKNTPADVDTSWTTEIRIPFSSVDGWPATGHSEPSGWNPAVPPVPGSLWRLNIERHDVRSIGDSEWDWSIWNHDSSYPYGSDFSGVHLHDPYNFGAILFTDPVAVERTVLASALPQGLAATPNPVSGEVRFDLPEGTEEVRIYDLAGRSVVSLIPDSRSPFLIWRPLNLPRGLYLARAHTVEGGTRDKRLTLLR